MILHRLKFYSVFILLGIFLPLLSMAQGAASSSQEAIFEIIDSRDIINTEVISSDLETYIKPKNKLAIVIDDIGYLSRDFQVLDLPVTVAILPSSPNAQNRAELAHQKNREIFIHLPMLPFSRQYLETDTLTPDMAQDEMNRIINDAISHVPYAVGINNHTGSEMTADFDAMTKVFTTLKSSPLIFLDSLTTPKSQAENAAERFGRRILVRDVFLDNSQKPADINKQLDVAIKLARKNGVAIAIGHPHVSTIEVLKNRLSNLPEDIELVQLSELMQ